jgi:hypothetical protein
VIGCLTAHGVEVGGGLFCEWSFKRTSKILFGKIVWLSFIWLLVRYSAYMWNLSSVLRCGPFLWCLNICIVLWMVPNGWLWSRRCWANFDVWLLVRNARLCPLNLIEKFLPVWPTYALLHMGQVSLYIPDSVYLSVVFCFCNTLFPMVFCVRNAILMLVRLKMFVIKVVSLLVLVNVAHFCFSVGLGF